MLKPVKFGLLSLVLSIIVAGCSGGDGLKDDGVKPEAKQALASAAELAKKSDGNYDKLSDSEKQVILKMANNNEESARRLLAMMAHPPSEGNKGRGKK